MPDQDTGHLVNTREAHFKARVRGTPREATKRCHDHGLRVFSASIAAGGRYCICNVAAEDDSRATGWKILMAWRANDGQGAKQEMMDHIGPEPIFPARRSLCLRCQHKDFIPSDDYVCLLCREALDA